ncbi:MAG: HEAT repeat domain-containing protein [Candidatus Brocadiia bacterium]
MDRIARRLAVGIVLTSCLLAASARGAERPELATALEKVASYEHGASRAPLAAAADLVRDMAQSPRGRKKAEEALIAFLGSEATPAAKAFACRQLSLVGSAEAVPALARLLGDARLSHPARMALARIPGPEASQALRHALGRLSGQPLVGVVNSLGERGCKEAVPDLVRLAGAKERAAAEAAIAALGKIGGDQAARTLAAIRSQGPAELRPAATDALLRCADQQLERGQRAEALRIYRDVYQTARAEAARVAALRGRLAAGDREAWEPIVDDLASDSPRRRAIAAGFVRRIPAPEATRLFAEKLGQLPPHAQATLLDALAARGDSAALPAVVQAAGSEHAEVRVAALEALGALGDASVVQHLAEAAASSQGEARAAARRSLAALAGEGVDATLTAMAQEAEGAARAEAIRALAARGTTTAQEPLLAVAKGPDQAARRAAIEALARLADKRALPTLVALLAKTDDEAERKALQKAVAEVAGRIEDPDAAARPLLDAMAGADAEAKRSLLRLLGRIPAASALDALRRAVEHESPDVRDAAVRAIAAWPDPRPADDLLAIARSAEEPVHKVLALRGFVRLVGLAESPPQEKARRLAEAMELAARPQERKLVLSALAEVPHVAALELAMARVGEEVVEAEAAAAAIEIAKAIRKTHRKEAIAAVEKIAEAAKSPAVRQAAHNALIVVGAAVNIAPQGEASSPDGLEKDGAAGGDQAAIDENPDTYWDEANGKKLYRYVVTFPQAQRVAAISILGYEHHNYAPRAFQVLADGKPAATVRDARYQDNFLVVRFEPVRCKAVELKITGYYGQSPAIRELGIYAPGGRLPDGGAGRK